MAINATIEDGIATITLSHPPLNILTRAVMAELREAVERLEGETELRALLLAADGKHFSAGADVGEHLPPEHEQLIPEFLDTIAAIDRFPVPVIAAVRGRCLGGGFELVQAADLVVAGEGAAFGQPEIVLGVIAPAACALLPQRIPPGPAAELVLTGDPITAQRAHEIGLVARIVPDNRVEEEARELARRIARHSAAAVRLTKRALRSESIARGAAALERAGEIYLTELMQTHDALEGLQAFLDKRQPTWTHR